MKEVDLHDALALFGEAAHDTQIEDAAVQRGAGGAFEVGDGDGAGELQQALAQKIAGEANTLLETKLQALQQQLRTTLGVPAPAAQGSKPAAATAPAAKASGK